MATVIANNRIYGFGGMNTSSLLNTWTYSNVFEITQPPSSAPTLFTNPPSLPPTANPTNSPVLPPSDSPSLYPSRDPSNSPSTSPSLSPTLAPTRIPTFQNEFLQKSTVKFWLETSALPSSDHIPENSRIRIESILKGVALTSQVASIRQFVVAILNETNEKIGVENVHFNLSTAFSCVDKVICERLGTVCLTYNFLEESETHLKDELNDKNLTFGVYSDTLRIPQTSATDSASQLLGKRHICLLVSRVLSTIFCLQSLPNNLFPSDFYLAGVLSVYLLFSIRKGGFHAGNG